MPLKHIKVPLENDPTHEIYPHQYHFGHMDRPKVTGVGKGHADPSVPMTVNEMTGKYIKDVWEALKNRSNNLLASVTDLFTTISKAHDADELRIAISGHKTSVFIVVAIFTIIIGSIIIMIYFWKTKSHKEKLPRDKSSRTTDNAAAGVVTQINTQDIPRTPNSRAEPISTPSTQRSLSTVRSFAQNTTYDLEEFIFRLAVPGIVVKRIKGDEQKVRCISINQKALICLHKIIPRLPAANSNKPYYKVPLVDLRDCFVADGSSPPSFIMEFTSKTIHLAADSKLDAAFMVRGFQTLIKRIAQEKGFHSKLRQLIGDPEFRRRRNGKFAHSHESSGYSSDASSPSLGHSDYEDGDDDDGDTHSGYSYNSDASSTPQRTGRGPGGTANGMARRSPHNANSGAGAGAGAGAYRSPLLGNRNGQTFTRR